jgi:hypothetical protein
VAANYRLQLPPGHHPITAIVQYTAGMGLEFLRIGLDDLLLNYIYALGHCLQLLIPIVVV